MCVVSQHIKGYMQFIFSHSSNLVGTIKFSLRLYTACVVQTVIMISATKITLRNDAIMKIHSKHIKYREISLHKLIIGCPVVQFRTEHPRSELLCNISKPLGDCYIFHHYRNTISVIASQITSVPIVCSAVCSGVDQRKYPRHWPLWGNPPVTGGFSSQRASDAENVLFDDIIMMNGRVFVRFEVHISFGVVYCITTTPCFWRWWPKTYVIGFWEHLLETVFVCKFRSNF